MFCIGNEPERLAEERATVLESTKELAYDNYPTFIETAGKSFKKYACITM